MSISMPRRSMHADHDVFVRRSSARGDDASRRRIRPLREERERGECGDGAAHNDGCRDTDTPFKGGGACGVAASNGADVEGTTVKTRSPGCLPLAAGGSLVSGTLHMASVSMTKSPSVVGKDSFTQRQSSQSKAL